MDSIIKANSQEAACTVCGAASVHVFTDITGVPVNCNVLLKTKDEAFAAEKGEIRLGFCTSCGHIFNTIYDASRIMYSQDYENSLHYSPLFQEYARTLAFHLMNRYNLYGKDIIEIGCGKGDFLVMMSRLGGNRGIGFDKSYDSSKGLVAGDESEKVVFIQDYYSEKYAKFKGDIIICRQVLEHIASPRAFLSSLRQVITRPDTIVFFEVPNVMHILKDFGFWDIIYEHCSYFVINSLMRLFALCGFKVVDAKEAYAGQYLCIEALPSEQPAAAHEKCDDLRPAARLVAAFKENFKNKYAFWKSKLKSLEKHGRRTVVWGAGSKGVMFLNMLGVDEQHIKYVVDVNPRKFGRHMPGTGQEIVKPEFLLYYRPHSIIVMNPIYTNEISQMIREYKLEAKILTA